MKEKLKLLQQENKILTEHRDSFKKQLQHECNINEKLNTKIMMLEKTIRGLQVELNCKDDKIEQLENDINNATERMQGFLNSVDVDRLNKYASGKVDTQG